MYNLQACKTPVIGNVMTPNAKTQLTKGWEPKRLDNMFSL